ncbi:uncharacterized protein LOC120254607 [Dioscorea cayenensis subsp. rotundata]|uniref:Uncharacterized protein LOC120254607 n=1 Tax=Dioscorea cayennensis subsp. rotundata TaxID=55577 RepID=A0AB40AU20_DIOCR|nr:uncharacterized protein LOC120254607 [Dioscorea cayenensis subsp. rotundata]XP_039118620.1 uncharacterized protein LOC120254607 [Dioscorea cayenensis subsp. rotundata]
MKSESMNSSTSSTSTTTTSSTAESPIGQTLIKLISNLCFSLFVLSVLLFTVLAITYQPPDPWLDSSRALTTSLTSTLPNSTFHTDDSLLPTGEDLIPLSPTPSPSSDPLVPRSPEICTFPTPINCSDPRALDAVRRFTAEVFSRRGIVFLSFDPPVAGPNPGECDAAWRFRNKREKSWRKYRDFRRFRLFSTENCTYDVRFMGKFRSGVNARSPPGKIKSLPVEVVDSEVNDTIPTVGSEAEFKNGRYLYYSRGGDYCKGMNHYLWSFLCGLGEAMFLNRTFVIDLDVCLASEYTSSGKDEDGKDFRYYFDFEHLKESASVVEEQEFLRGWRTWDRAAKGKKSGGGKITVRKVPTYKVTPMQLKRDRSMILWRQFDGPEPENYWYRVCEGRAAKFVQRPWQAVWKSKRLMDIVTQIAAKMDWDYDAVHVVRGGKAMNKNLWPNLDSDTSPDALVQKLLKVIYPWRNLYVATNEPFYNHFDKLRSHYHVHLLDDYKEFWGNTSEWYNETRVLNGGKAVEFDGYMRVAVDTEVLYRAKTQVETFNNLTSDCKDGINTC